MENQFATNYTATRPLYNIHRDEALHLVWLAMNCRIHMPEELSKDEIQIDDIIPNDGGTMLDGDVLLYISFTCSRFIGWISFMNDGRIGIVEEYDPSSRMKPLTNIAKVVTYLLSCGFDLSGKLDLEREE